MLPAWQTSEQDDHMAQKTGLDRFGFYVKPWTSSNVRITTV